MEDKKLKEALAKIKDSKKNFKQSIDLIINLKNLDPKNPDHQIEFFVQLPKDKGKKIRVCALVGPELGDESKKAMDTVILQQEFDKQDKKAVKKLAENHDYFVAQATIMPKVASAFGRVLGPKGKMPNPKAGCIVPPNANMKQVYDKLQKTVRISTKKGPLVQTMVGKEDSSEDELTENIKHIYNNLVHHLPQGENNVKSVFVKKTMGVPARIM